MSSLGTYENAIVEELKKHSILEHKVLLKNLSDRGLNERTAKAKLPKLDKDGTIIRLVDKNRRPPAVFYCLPNLVSDHLSYKEEYSDLNPRNALIVARIDFFLEHFIDERHPGNKQFIDMLKLMKNYHIREGRALGR